MILDENQLVIDLHHVAVWVADVREAAHRYEMLLGMHGEQQDDGTALLRCMHEDYCLWLQPVPDGKEAGLNYVAYELRPGLSLDAAQALIEERGESAERIAVPVRGQGLLLRDPDDNGVVVLERVPPADPRSPMMIETTTLRGYHPRRLGHVNYLTSDVPRAGKWYADVLGFRFTDWIEDDAAVWMHIDARHHVIAFLNKEPACIHHIAFELPDWGDMRVMLDNIAKHGRFSTWGPIRHGMAQNIATYWRMWEEKYFIEIYCDMQVLAVDHQPVVHPDNAYSSSTWGILPPRTYFRFDDEAVEIERTSAYSKYTK
ncbi:MAG: VOC family protein [Candidatus Promineifilaceae bacterium]